MSSAAAVPANTRPPQLRSVQIASASAPAQRNATAAMLTFIIAAIGLWAALTYMQEMSTTLASVDATNAKIVKQMGQANAGLKQLDTKTKTVGLMTDHSLQLEKLMSGIDGNMGSMLAGVEAISAQMGAMSATLTALNDDMSRIVTADQTMVTTLGTINSGLAQQSGQVAGMRTDLIAAAAGLKKIPPTLAATNRRLAHVNQTVCFMGRNGLQSQINVAVDFLGIPNGRATINATMVPPGSWC